MSDRQSLEQFALRLGEACALGPIERDALLSLPTEAGAFEAHRDFVQRGVSEFAFLVVEGLVARYSDTGQGKRQITGLYIPGEVANLGAATLTSTLTLQGLSDGRALRIPLASIRSLIAEHPKLAACFWRETVREAAIAAEWMLSLGRRNAAERVAHLLCETGWRLEGGAVSDGGDYAFRVTQSQLAEILGLTPVHVNRTLRDIREQGLASLRGRRVTIHDWDGLARLGDFDPAYLGDHPRNLSTQRAFSVRHAPLPFSHSQRL